MLEPFLDEQIIHHKKILYIRIPNRFLPKLHNQFKQQQQQS